MEGRIMKNGMVVGVLCLATGCGVQDSLDTSRLAATASPIKIDASCPAPTRKDNGGHCVLDDDLEISAPLELGSSTKLNCKGHRLRPIAAGQDGPAGAGYTPSVPEVAVL